MENLDAEEQFLIKQLEVIRKKKEELSKPITATIENIYFSGLGGFIEIKLNLNPSLYPVLINKIRSIPSRSYISQREVNIFSLDYYDRIVYELNEFDIKLELNQKQEEQITEWKLAPDFIINLDNKTHQIRVNKSIRQKEHPYYFELSTWTKYPSYGYYSFTINELIKFHEVTINNKLVYEISDEVKELLKEQIEREKLLNTFADMIDAPSIDFEFSTGYKLKPDQRVAILFDDTFSGRDLISYDMGKGKTAIAIAQAERHNERVLFVCKADLKTNIKREIKKFTNKDATVFSGIEPSALDIDLMIKDDKKQQYNIINYDIIGRAIKDKETEAEFMKWVTLINMSNFDRIIFDEAHYMKNTSSQRSRAGMLLKSKKVMLLTGTPIVNRPAELYPILNIIDPITFSDQAVFQNQFTRIDGMPKNLPQLHKLLKKYMIRRTRSNELDPNRITQSVELSNKARKHYAEVYEGLYTSLRNPNYTRDVTNILTQLLRLKQITADDKVDFTVGLTETCLEETNPYPWNKVLVFSQFKATQAEICSRLGNKAAIINGDVTDRYRYDLIDKFQDPSSDLKVIVTNIVEGITLTQAGTTIANDLWWTPKDHRQQEGRAFGRENDPHGGNAYYVLSEDTIDDVIWNLLERKLSISKQIIDDVFENVAQDNSIISDLMKQIRGG